MRPHDANKISKGRYNSVDILVLVGDIVFGAGKKTLHGVISKRYLNNIADYYAGNGIMFTFMTFLFLISAVFDPFPSWISVLLAVLNGVGNALFQVFSSRAMSVGSVSLTVLITSFALIPPILFSLIVMGESIYLVQIIGFALLAVTFFLVVKPDRETKVNLRWLLYVGVAFIATSACGIIGKLRVYWVCNESVNWFLVVGAAVSAVVALLMSREAMHCQSIHLSFRLVSRATLTMFLCALSLAINNIFYMYCNILVPGTILFPVGNGAMMVLTMAVSALIFREQLTRRQWIGIATGIVSLLLICKVVTF